MSDGYLTREGGDAITLLNGLLLIFVGIGASIMVLFSPGDEWLSIPLVVCAIAGVFLLRFGLSIEKQDSSGELGT